jgi:hypothetical protein
MPLFLVTCVIDEGVYESDFRVVEATSKLAVAKDMLLHPSRWELYLRSAYNQEGEFMELLEYIHKNPDLTAEELLKKIEQTYVDGDSCAQLRIHEIKAIDKINENE